jgi:hypothetical protein
MKRKICITLIILIVLAVSVIPVSAAPAEQLCYIGAGTAFWVRPWKTQPAKADGKTLTMLKVLVPLNPTVIGSVRAVVWQSETVLYLAPRSVYCIK